MLLRKLRFSGFRNLAAAEVQLSPGVTLLVGENAQGKTNFLEAIYFLATAHSYRPGRERELIRWGTAEARLAGEVEAKGLREELEVRLRQAPTPGKALYRNGNRLKFQEYLGILRVVTFFPERLVLVRGGPEERRRFLDLMLAQVSPGYRYYLAMYQKTLMQRNRLLRQIREGEATAEALAPWDEHLLRFGLPLQRKRAGVLQELANLARRLHDELSGGREKLTLLYRPVPEWDKREEDQPEAVFRAELNRRHGEELARGVTLLGPHRDDFLLAFEEGETLREVRIYGSQGQQRTAALALYLAQLHWMEGVTGETPLLLLDDVLSELDGGRREALLRQACRQAQTVITATEAKAFHAFAPQVMRVEAGQIFPL